MGGGIMMVYFIAPAIQAAGPAGAPVMGHMAQKRKLPTILNYAAWITTLCGLALFWRASRGLQPPYFSTFIGISMAACAAAELLAFVGAVVIQSPRSKRIAQMAVGAGPNPTEAQAAAISSEQKKFRVGGKIVVHLFLLTLLGMLLSHPV